MAQQRGYRTSITTFEDFFGEPLSVVISEDDDNQSTSSERVCDGKHCNGCLCESRCDAKDSMDHDEESW